MQVSDAALRDSPGVLRMYNEGSASPQTFLGNSSPKSDRFIMPLHDDILTPTITPIYRFSSGIERRDSINSSFIMTPDLEPDEDSISASTPGSEFQRGPS